MKRRFKTIAQLVIVAGITAGCSTIEKAPLSANSPNDAITEVEEIRTQALIRQADVLGSDAFFEGEEELADAKDDLEDGDDTEDIMDSLGDAKAWYLKSIKEARAANVVPQRVLQAREQAMISGALNNKKLSKELRDIDEELIDETDSFTDKLSLKEFTEFQNLYQDLEVKGIQHQELGKVRKRIERAERKDADDLASKTFSKAMSDLVAAENAIEQNPRSVYEYQSEVEQAEFSSQLLADVTAKLRGEARGASESVALEMVKQDREVDVLSSQVSGLSNRLDNAQSAMIDMESSLTEKEQEYADAQQKIAYQQALTSVQKEFGSDEAEVYQQGDKVILRLKKLPFKVGSAEVPENSQDLLSKIDSVIEDLNASTVTVQGHTDSTGSVEINEKLSEQRAQAIKNYFANSGEQNFNIETKGLGESQPIASNSTKEGRALNRRVDIVIDTKSSNTTNTEGLSE